MYVKKATGLIFLLLGVLLLTGCASFATSGQRYTAERVYAVRPGVDLTTVGELAMKVFRQQGITLSGSSPESGYLSGLAFRGSGINRMSFILVVYISEPATGKVQVKATSEAGPEVAFTTDLDDIAEDFVLDLGKLLGN